MTEKELIAKLKEINISINQKQIDQLNKYYQLLIDWNKKMNLTGITNKNDVFLKHFYDSATIFTIIDLNIIESLCDVGSGAGFPGIVIKILFPNLKITLVDSLNKRITFLKEVIKELELTNIEAIHDRIEDYSTKNPEKYDLITARAVAKTNVLLELAVSMININGYYVIMKGKLIDENYEKAMKLLSMEEVKKKKFILPYENSSRYLLLFKKVKRTSKIFPRKYKEIIDKPL